MHVVASAVAFAGLVLYAHRSGWLAVHGTQSFWALVTRAGMAGVLATVSVGFMDLAVIGAPFEWRHWLIFSALLLAVVGHLGMVRGGFSNPT